eukprot:5145116-Prymnesium_polylepis.1
MLRPCLCLTHRAGDMCRLVLNEGAPCLPACPVVDGGPRRVPLPMARVCPRTVRIKTCTRVMSVTEKLLRRFGVEGRIVDGTPLHLAHTPA